MAVDSLVSSEPTLLSDVKLVPETTIQPAAEPSSSEPKPASESSSASAEPTPSAEPKPQSEVSAETTVKSSSPEPTPSAEPKAEPEPAVSESLPVTTLTNDVANDQNMKKEAQPINVSPEMMPPYTLLNDSSTSSQSPVEIAASKTDSQMSATLTPDFNNIQTVSPEYTNQGEIDENNTKKPADSDVESITNLGNLEASSSKPLDQLIFDPLANKNESITNENMVEDKAGNELVEQTSIAAKEAVEVSVGTVKTDVLSVSNETEAMSSSSVKREDVKPTAETAFVTEIRQSEETTIAALKEESSTKEINASSIKMETPTVEVSTNAISEMSSVSANVIDSGATTVELKNSSQSTEAASSAPTQITSEQTPVSEKLVSNDDDQKAAAGMSKRESLTSRDTGSFNALSNEELASLSGKNRVASGVKDETQVRSLTSTKRRARTRTMLSNLIRAIATDRRLNPSSHSSATV